METDFGIVDFKLGWGVFRLLLDPRIGVEKRLLFEDRLRAVAPEGNGIWIASSGTTRKEGERYRFLALSEQALLTSAQAVNAHLGATKNDLFVSCLPDFHVGGLGLQIRAHLLGARFVRSAGNDRPWNVAEFVRDIDANRGTIVSLVPTQLVDIVRAGLGAPPSVRVAVIGGGALSLREYQRGRELGWPLLPSYGCTECSSQIATASLSSLKHPVGAGMPTLELLSHIEAREDAGVLSIKSEALFSRRVRIAEDSVSVEDHPAGVWYRTSDLVELHGRMVRPCGRVDDLIKIGGEGVNLHELSLLVRDIREGVPMPGDIALRPLPDERLGYVLALDATDMDLGEVVKERFNEQVLPFARIRSVEHVSSIERTALGKIVKNSGVGDDS